MRLSERLLRLMHPFSRSSWTLRGFLIALVVAVMLIDATPAPAYSVLTHEQIIDLLWKDRIVPLLKKRFPQATEDDLREAHAYAYGGSMVQDMGYYPFGNKFFSDLLHYVRTGDFVEIMIGDAADLNEYAFALGALAHYTSDNTGHPTVNRSVAAEFPKLKKKYGPEVTYADDPKAHIRVEFGFDMVQVAKNRYTSDRYHDFIGFEVSQRLLEQAFYETYGIKLQEVLTKEDLAIGTFRWSVSRVIPQMTRVALLSRKKEMVREDPTFDEKKFRFYLSRVDYEKQWGKGYRRPGFGSRVLALLLKVVPKIGPFKALAFKIPTSQTEDMYIKSVDKTVENYASQLKHWDGHALKLDNRDCDTGRETQLGEYSLSDATYAKLLDKLSEDDFQHVLPRVRADILQYFDTHTVTADKKLNTEKAQRKLQEQLEKLRGADRQVAESPVESDDSLNSDGDTISGAVAPDSSFQEP